MEKETIEEAAERLAIHCNNDFIKGAKWQQERSYSEEEVYSILVEHTVELFKGEPQTLNEFFNKFKKK